MVLAGVCVVVAVGGLCDVGVVIQRARQSSLIYKPRYTQYIYVHHPLNSCAHEICMYVVYVHRTYMHTYNQVTMMTVCGDGGGWRAAFRFFCSVLVARRAHFSLVYRIVGGMFSA